MHYFDNSATTRVCPEAAQAGAAIVTVIRTAVSPASIFPIFMADPSRHFGFPAAAPLPRGYRPSGSIFMPHLL